MQCLLKKNEGAWLDKIKVMQTSHEVSRAKIIYLNCLLFMFHFHELIYN